MSIETAVQKADPNLPLRLALSHRAKAREGLAQCKRDVDAGILEKAAYDLQIIELEHELARAEATVRKLRDAERASMVRLESNLRLLREEQEDLPEAVRRGVISASGANDANRSLRRRIAVLEEGIGAAKTRLTAEHPEELGGRVELPFEKYQGEVPYVPRPVGAAEWAIALVLSVVAAASLFLPWIHVENGDYSLVGLSRASGEIGSGLGAFRLLWLPLALLPFASLPIVALRRKGLVGWGLLVLGVLVAAAGLLPGPLVNRGSLFGLTPGELGRLFRLGSLLYCAAGLAFIVMGGLRVGNARIALRKRLAAGLLFGGIMAAAVLGVMGLIYLSGGGSQVSFEASLALPGQDTIRVVCRCTGAQSADVYTSWSNRKTSTGSVHEAGMDVYVRERGQTAFRLVPNTEAAWTTAGTQGEGEGSFRVLPGSTLELTLDLRRLTALGTDAEAVRLEFYDRARVLEPFEAKLGGAYLSPPAETAAKPAEQGPSLAAKRPSTEPPPPTPVSATVPPPPPSPPLLVSFVGTLGEKAILKVVRGGATEERVVAAAGESIDKDWSVAKIERAPSAVTLTNSSQNADRVILRGETIDLNAGF